MLTYDKLQVVSGKRSHQSRHRACPQRPHVSGPPWPQANHQLLSPQVAPVSWTSLQWGPGAPWAWPPRTVHVPGSSPWAEGAAPVRPLVCVDLGVAPRLGLQGGGAGASRSILSPVSFWGDAWRGAAGLNGGHLQQWTSVCLVLSPHEQCHRAHSCVLGLVSHSACEACPWCTQLGPVPLCCCNIPPRALSSLHPHMFQKHCVEFHRTLLGF